MTELRIKPGATFSYFMCLYHIPLIYYRLLLVRCTTYGIQWRRSQSTGVMLSNFQTTITGPLTVTVVRLVSHGCMNSRPSGGREAGERRS